jgi:hypothetical protein
MARRRLTKGGQMRKAVVVLLIFAACGGDGGGWSEQARTDYIAGCEDSGAPRDLCECVQQKLEARHPDLDDPTDIDQGEVVEFSQDCP